MQKKLPTINRKLAPIKPLRRSVSKTARSATKQKSTQRTILRQKSKEEFLGYKPDPPKQTAPVAEVFDQRLVEMMKHILGLGRDYRVQFEKKEEWGEVRYEGLTGLSLLQNNKEAKELKSKMQSMAALQTGGKVKPSKKTSKKPLAGSRRAQILPTTEKTNDTQSKQQIEKGFAETEPKPIQASSDSKEAPESKQETLQDEAQPEETPAHIPIACAVIECLLETAKSTLKPSTAKARLSQKNFMIKSSGLAKSKAPIPVCTTFSKGEFKLFRYFFKVGEWVRVSQTQARYVHFARESYTEWEAAKKSVVSTVPGLEMICRKRTLGQVVNMLRRVYPATEWFMPETFLLPEDHEEYLKAHLESKARVYIAKASGGSQGQGVRILTRPADLPPPNTVKSYHEAVVQRYIANPLLIDGLKHDLRLYILIAHPDPLVVYLNEEGLARFCTQPYSDPASGKIDPSSHLTNFAINKRSANFSVTEELLEANRGSKRTLSSYWKSLEQAGLDSKHVRAKITRLVQGLMKAIQPHLKLYSTKHFEKGVRDSRLMHILGVDVLIDSSGNPWVLELNSMPSMAIESEGPEAPQVYLIDFYVKSQ